MSSHGGALVHGSYVSTRGKSILLMGHSGVGKTTLSKLFVAEGDTCLTEENPILTWHEETAWIHATLWPGIIGPAAPLSSPLDAIVFLRHSPVNQLRQLSVQAAGKLLLNNTRFFSWLPWTIPSAIDLLDRTISKVPAYDFGFVPDSSAPALIRDVLH